MDYLFAIPIGIPVAGFLLFLAISQSRRNKATQGNPPNHTGTSYTEPQDEGAEVNPPMPAGRVK